MAKFFIDRPIFAWVIALFIMVMGAVSITQLPIAQYPPVAPPSIVIAAAVHLAPPPIAPLPRRRWCRHGR